MFNNIDDHFMARDLQREIQQFGRDYDLVFFFRSDCEDALALAQVLLKFESLYQWRIWPVSLNGEGIADFPHPLTAPEIAKQFNLKVHPAVIALNRYTHHWIPLVYGLATLENLEREVINTLLEGIG